MVNSIIKATQILELALLAFDGGAKGVFTTTCLLEGTRQVYLKLICEELLITIEPGAVTFGRGLEQRQVRVDNDLIAAEDRMFIEAVRRSDPFRLLSSYEDALLTHRLCFDVLDATKNQSG